MSQSTVKSRDRVQPVQKNNKNAQQIKTKRKKPKFFDVTTGFDMPFFITVILLVITGLIMMFSASYPSAYYYRGDSYAFFLPQLVFAVVGVIAMIVISTVDYRQLRRWAYVAYVVSTLLLVIVLFMPAENGIHRWITIGVQFQPSEIAKFAVILVLACWASTHPNKMDTLKTGLVLPLIFVAITAVLLVLEPHYSCTVIILLLALVMLFLSGTKLVYFIFIVGGGAGLASILYFSGVLSGYLDEKFAGWRHALEYVDDHTFTWQTRNSLYAIGSGGLLGLGPGQSRQKHLFLPEPQNDFIFAIVAEELGFVGATLILVMFAYLVFRGINICMKAPDTFGKLLGTGLCVQIGLQVVLNIFVITDLLPNTGISLPFFSYGGTSMLMLLAQMGVVLSITRQARAEKY